MSVEIKHTHRAHPVPGLPEAAKNFDVLTARKVNTFHAGFPDYAPTPLAALSSLARELGIAGIHVKDESKRFGLNAFKVLGGSYCLGDYIAEKLGKDIRELPYSVMTGAEVRAALGEITFVTATDGNHGRGIAWTVSRLGQKSVVYMPRGTAAERLENIRVLGAEACVTDLNYDDTVRLARRMAEEKGWVLVQDTAWPGYEKIPVRIMQGYTSMGWEIAEQLGDVKPTHIFLQAGVGAMAGAMAGFFTNYYGIADRPRIIIVEPEKADCMFRTAAANDGRLHTAAGDLSTIMAGLACGEPCTVGWEVLSECADDFISMPDTCAARGMRVLGNPLGNDPRIISGESGAATVGFVATVLRNEKYRDIRHSLDLNGHSRVLCISTEGDTDRENYRKIVWDGAYASDCESLQGLH